MIQTQTQTQTAVTASGASLTTCQKSGPYKSRSTPQVTIFVGKGQKFPLDPNGKKTTWDMVKP